jgi:UDP-glucose 4-epimerase
MTFLVIGAAGFIGTSAGQHLFQHGERAADVDKFGDCYSVALNEVWLDCAAMRINGSLGFIFRTITAMIANLGAEMT